LNTASLPVLTALLRLLGADERQALVLGSQIADWRSPANFPLKDGAKAPQYRAAGRVWGPSNRPFRDVHDVALVLGMTPELLARLAPHVSVFTQSSPTPANADPLVLAAMRDADAGGAQPLTFDETPVYRITAIAYALGGSRFIRRAVIRLNTGADSTRVMDVLGWFEGPPGTVVD
jgi:general secretion pathway protein K